MSPPEHYMNAEELLAAGQIMQAKVGLIHDVSAEFPNYGVDEVFAELQRRGCSVSREFVATVFCE